MCSFQGFARQFSAAPPAPAVERRKGAVCVGDHKSFFESRRRGEETYSPISSIELIRPPPPVNGSRTSRRERFSVVPDRRAILRLLNTDSPKRHVSQSTRGRTPELSVSCIVMSSVLGTIPTDFLERAHRRTALDRRSTCTIVTTLRTSYYGAAYLSCEFRSRIDGRRNRDQHVLHQYCEIHLSRNLTRYLRLRPIRKIRNFVQLTSGANRALQI